MRQVAEVPYVRVIVKQPLRVRAVYLACPLPQTSYQFDLVDSDSLQAERCLILRGKKPGLSMITCRSVEPSGNRSIHDSAIESPR